MLSKLFGLVLCVSYVLAGSEVHYRAQRSPSSSSGSGSYSSSSSSSSSGSVGSGHGGGGGGGGFFSFPTPMPYFPPTAGFPIFDFNQMFQQFLSTAQAAHSFAAQNPAYAKVFQQQMSMLASLQQMALAQYPFAFPGFDLSNSITPENYGQSAGGVWSGAPGGAYGPVAGSSGTGSYGSGAYGSGTLGSGSYGSGTLGSGSYGSGTHGSGTHGSGGYGSAPGGGSIRTGGYGGGFKTGSDPAVFTSGSASLGPQGGYIHASSAPGGPDGLGVRISEELPAPGGGTFGTFSSSSSGVSNINGKTTSYKTSSVGINDNGKITFRTVSE